VLATRIWTAAVALPAVAAAIVFLPSALFSLFIVVLGAWGLYEVAMMSQATSLARRVAVIIAGGVPLVGLTLSSDPPWMPAALVFVIMAAVVAMVAIGGPAAGTKGMALTVIGAAYVGALFPYFALLRNRPGGIAAVLFVLLLVVAADTGAYFAGTYLGQIKLAPRVSPHKTVEGAIGEIVASEVAGLILAPMLAPALGLGRTLAASGAIAALAIVGDLAGSALKRSAGVKDSGWLFPGHGGLLDRTCSLVFAVVFAYYWLA
jgi:phosphatidate cytidylyltransferase